jgi:hypothetical protein
MAMEDEFGFEIPDDHAEKLLTPAKIVQETNILKCFSFSLTLRHNKLRGHLHTGFNGKFLIFSNCPTSNERYSMFISSVCKPLKNYLHIGIINLAMHFSGIFLFKSSSMFPCVNNTLFNLLTSFGPKALSPQTVP